MYPFFQGSHCLICHPARCFLNHVTVSWDPLSWSIYHSWAKNIAQISHLVLAIIPDHGPLPLVKKKNQFRFLGNWPPTPSLSHHFFLSEKEVLILV